MKIHSYYAKLIMWFLAQQRKNSVMLRKSKGGVT